MRVYLHFSIVTCHDGTWNLSWLAAENGEMPDLFHHGRLTVPHKRGIYADSGLTDKVADFSYESDALAEMIARAWTDPTFKAKILTAAGAKSELAARGFSLKNPIVVEESSYVTGYHAAADAVVFVIPDPGRITTSGPLLETAKLLMPVTPNGI
jgi:hypothetical protein